MSSRHPDDDDFDDDDNRPRRESETGGSGMAAWLFCALGLGALVVVGALACVIRSRKKERDDDAAQNTSIQPSPAVQKPQDLRPAPKPERSWPALKAEYSWPEP